MPASRAATGGRPCPLGDGVRPVQSDPFERLPSVRRLVQVSVPYRLASRELFGEGMAIEIPLAGDRDGEAGYGQVRRPRPARRHRELAVGLSQRGAVPAPRAAAARGRLPDLPRGADGARRPTARDRPELTEDALRRLADIAHEHGLALCVEVADASQIATAVEIADVLQVGSRNMQDFSLLREMGGIRHPVLLRRGAGATVEEFLLAAEYVLVHGNGKVILCESGIRTFDALRKPRFEINAMPLIKQLSHLPLVADPSQTAPHAATVPAMAKAAVAAGADGLVLEVGTEAVYDPEGVAIDIEAMRNLMSELRPIARAVGRTVGPHGSAERGARAGSGRGPPT